MAGKADAKEPCRFCGSKDEKDINRLYSHRDAYQNIIWYVLCKECEATGERIDNTKTN